MSDKRRSDELAGDMSEEMELEIDEAVAKIADHGDHVAIAVTEHREGKQPAILLFGHKSAMPDAVADPLGGKRILDGLDY